MRVKLLFVLSALSATLCALPAQAQTAAVRAQADVGFEPGKAVRGFLGPRLGIYNTVIDVLEQPLSMFSPQLEGGIWIVDWVEISLALGVLVTGDRYVDGGFESSHRQGNVLLELGVRAHLMQPRPGRPFLYLGATFAPVFGVVKVESDGIDDELVDEDGAKEALDYANLGLTFGLEYLVSANFGIGAESGLLLSINSLKETHDEEPDTHRSAGLQIPFLLRFMYHF